MAAGDSKLANPFAGPAWAAFVTRQSDPDLSAAFQRLVETVRARSGGTPGASWRDLHALLGDEAAQSDLRASTSAEIYERVVHVVERGASFEARREAAG